jgi:glycosyltransferase involved in cell wall biosynthesis
VEEDVLMNHPKVSVLMPMYNARKYLAETVESILGQTFENFELVAIDDGSTDDSAEIIARFTDPRIRLVRNEKNLGIARTLNMGVGICHGEYIARMDADDIAVPSRLEKQCAFLDSHPDVEMVGADILRIDSSGKPLAVQYRNPGSWGKLKWHMFLDCCIAHPTVMARRAFFGKAGAYQSMHAEDFSLWHSAIHKRLRLVNLPEPLLRYRVHSQSISMAKYAQQLESAAEITCRYAEERLGFNLDRRIAVDHFQLPDRPIPIASVIKLTPFYLRLAWASMRDPETTAGDTLFLWRRMASRLLKGGVRSIFGQRGQSIPRQTEASRERIEAVSVDPDGGATGLPLSGRGGS